MNETDKTVWKKVGEFAECSIESTTPGKPNIVSIRISDIWKFEIVPDEYIGKVYLRDGSVMNFGKSEYPEELSIDHIYELYDIVTV